MANPLLDLIEHCEIAGDIRTRVIKVAERERRYVQ
jgi:hypothetical protein